MKVKRNRRQNNQKETGLSGWLKGLLAAIAIAGIFGLGMLAKENEVFSRLWISLQPTLEDSLDEIETELNTEAHLYQSNSLETITLDIPFESMQFIEAKRAEALEIGILLSSDDDYVPASMRFGNDDSIDIDMRLKGDWTDHLAGDKWSFRIHIDDDDASVFGMRRFSLQDPETRNYVYEWAFHQHLITEGILTTRYEFVNVIMNGDYKGVYALEESFTEDLLESQGRREGVILRWDEDPSWTERAEFYNDGFGEIHIDFLDLYDNNSILNPFRNSRIEDNLQLKSEDIEGEQLLYSYSQQLLVSDQVFDELQWGKFIAIADLWAAPHTVVWHNLRFYYNPVTSLIEPIAFDAQPKLSANMDLMPREFFSDYYEFLRNPTILKHYLETLEEISSEDYIGSLEEKLTGVDQYSEILRGEYPDIPDFEHFLWQLRTRADMIRHNFNPAQAFIGGYHISMISGIEYLQLDLMNQMDLPVQINAIETQEERMTASRSWCVYPSCQQNILEDEILPVVQSDMILNGRLTTFMIPVNDPDSINTLIETESPLVIHVNIFGSSNALEINIFPDEIPKGITEPSRPEITLSETLEAHEFLKQTADDELMVMPGDWDVEGDFIIPRGYRLKVFGNTVLRFEEESVFLTYGAIDFTGNEESAIQLTAQEDNWGGLVVLNADEESTWDYVTVEKTGGIERGGWILTGGVTFYESPIRINNSRISDNSTEDALNVIRSKITFDRVEFYNTPSDAFDGDFINGTITNCSFHHIGGDALDVSGSQIFVTDSHFVEIADKGISAGEMSRVSIADLTIRNVGIGIASKDLSHVLAERTSITNARVAGLAAYIKKPQYGRGEIEIWDSVISETDEIALCQIGSWILVQGEEIAPIEIDVDTLYELGILGN